MRIWRETSISILHNMLRDCCRFMVLMYVGLVSVGEGRNTRRGETVGCHGGKGVFQKCLI